MKINVGKLASVGSVLFGIAAAILSEIANRQLTKEIILEDANKMRKGS